MHLGRSTRFTATEVVALHRLIPVVVGWSPALATACARGVGERVDVS